LCDSAREQTHLRQAARVPCPLCKFGLRKTIKRSDLAVANNDDIQSGVSLGPSLSGPIPCQNSSIMQGLWLSMGRIHEVWVCGAPANLSSALCPTKTPGGTLRPATRKRPAGTRRTCAKRPASPFARQRTEHYAVFIAAADPHREGAVDFDAWSLHQHHPCACSLGAGRLDRQSARCRQAYPYRPGGRSLDHQSSYDSSSTLSRIATLIFLQATVQRRNKLLP
jgi:hypothetical protein